MSQRLREVWNQTREAYEREGYPVGDGVVDLSGPLAAMREGTRLHLPDEIAGAGGSVEISRLPVVFGDRDRFRRRRLAFVGVAAAVVAVVLGVRLSTGALVCLLAVDYVWNAWHFAAQHHGIYRVYGRAVTAAGKAWLQYWLFSYYNPQNVLGFGVHEYLSYAPETASPVRLVWLAAHRSRAAFTVSVAKSANIASKVGMILTSISTITPTATVSTVAGRCPPA